MGGLLASAGSASVAAGHGLRAAAARSHCAAHFPAVIRDGFPEPQFQVISVDGRPLRYVDYQDNVAMPPGSTIVIRMRPTDFTGKFVIHCHVTNHEDRGMMAAVQVVRSPTPAQLRTSAATGGGLSIHSSAYGAPALAAAGAPALAGTAAARQFALLCHLLGLSPSRLHISPS